MGDENGRLIFDGNLDQDGRPNAGMLFSDGQVWWGQQLALGHYESNGGVQTGLNIYNCGLESEYRPL